MINPNPDEKQFLTLAERKLSGKATSDESSCLARCVQENEAYRATFEHMQALQQTERNDQFLQIAIRVLCGTATPKESGKIRALEKNDPQLWQKFQFMRAVVKGIARAANVKDDIKPEPMPERVRLALAAKLRDVKRERAD
jgi:hypothetical protein